MNADILIEVRFFTTEEGGRQTPLNLSKGEFPFGCPFVFSDGEAFDCWLLFASEKVYEFGTPHQIPVKFLSWDLVKSKLTVGEAFTLWEGKTIATGKVLRILKETL